MASSLGMQSVEFRGVSLRVKESRSRRVRKSGVKSLIVWELLLRP